MSVFRMFKQVDFQSEFARGEPIQFEGRTLWSAHWADVARDQQVVVSFERFTDKPVQGLMVAGRKRSLQLEVAGRRADQFVLWTDTAPREVSVRVVKAAPGDQLGFWNVWRDEKHDSLMYGLNAAAIHVSREADGSVLLNCSDGWRGPDFEDLVVRLRGL
jgi:hypothetical protein